MILVDTTPLVAMCDRSDVLHTRALKDLDRFARQSFSVSDAVLAEAMLLLPAAPARARLAGLVEGLPLLPWSDDEPIEARRAALRWMARYGEHDPDWADATLVIASSRAKRARVWTYDSEFRTIWRRLDGTRVPLAVRG